MPFLNDAFALPKITLLRLITLVIFVLLALRLAGKSSGLRIKFPRTQLNIPVLAFLGIAVFSTILSIDPALSLRGMYRFYFNGFLSILCYVIIYFSVLSDVGKKEAEVIIKAMLAGSLLVVAYGFLQNAGLEPFRWSTSSAQRAWSTMGNPNFLGAYLIMIIPLCAAVFINTVKKPEKTGLFILFIALCAGLAITKSRASWLGFVCSMIVFALFLGKNAIKKHGRWILGLFLVIITGGILLRLIKPESLHSITGRIASIADFGELDIASRLAGYRIALKVISENVIFGSGLDVFSISFRQYMPLTYLKFGGGLVNQGYAHNELLQVALDMGLIGLGVCLWLLVSFFRKALSVITNRGHNEQERVIALGITCSVVALLVQNQFSFSVITTSVFFWIFLAMITVIDVPDGKQFVIKRKFPPVPVYAVLVVLSGYILLNVFRPLYADAHFTRANVLMNNNRGQAAIGEYRKAVSLNPRLSVYRINLGRAYRDAGGIENLKKAISEFETQVKKNPKNALGWNGLGACRYSLAKLNNDIELLRQSISALKRAVELDPNFTEAHLFMGYGYEKMEMADKAITAYNDVLKIDPDNPSVHFNLGCIYGNKRMSERAAHHWNEALRIDPGHSKAREYLKLLDR